MFVRRTGRPAGQLHGRAGSVRPACRTNTQRCFKADIWSFFFLTGRLNVCLGKGEGHMSLAVLNSCALSGLDFIDVRVEAHVAPGLPAFHIVGLPAARTDPNRGKALDYRVILEGLSRYQRDFLQLNRCWQAIKENKKRSPRPDVCRRHGACRPLACPILPHLATSAFLLARIHGNSGLNCNASAICGLAI